MTAHVPDPIVCPGCYAVGEEPCAVGCIDAEIEQEARDERLYGSREYCDQDCQCCGDECVTPWHSDVPVVDGAA